jgi:membrane-associated phospholipid phosphatase
LPLRDGALASLDAALGFQWPLFLGAANANPWFSRTLVVAYHSVGPQIPLVFIILAAVRHEARLREFVALIAITSLLTGIGMALVPAAGAYAYFKPPPEAFSNFTNHAGMWHYTELVQLRSGEPFVYLADRTKGLVTFPSFHTVLAIVVTYAFRDYRWVFPPLAALNTLMIVATVPEGGHHVIDVIAGIAIALVSVAFMRVLERGAIRRNQAA